MRVPLPIKLMISYLLVAGLIAIPSLWFLRRSLDASLEGVEVRELRGRVESLRDLLARVPDGNFDRAVRESAMLLGLRVTVVDRAGVVLNDSDVPQEKVVGLENQHDLPEIMAALSGGFGSSRRKSALLGSVLLYGAVPLPGPGPMPSRAVVRVATRASVLHDAVSSTLLALRLAAGVSVSAAILLSLVAALFVSFPLRRMRDAARAFAEGRWITVKRVRTGDELEDLSTALEALGARLRGQLIEVGAQETLLLQAVRSVPVPAALLRPDGETLLLNGALRQFLGLTADNEAVRIEALTDSAQFRAARREAERTALPIELVLAVTGSDGAQQSGAPGADGTQQSGAPYSDSAQQSGAPYIEGEKARGSLVPLCRPSGPPLWLLYFQVDGPESEARGPEAVQLHLRGMEVMLLGLWDEQPTLRPVLARLRRRLDDTAHAAGRPESVGVEPVDGATLISRSIDEVRVLYPEAAGRLNLDLMKATCKLAESAGLLSRAVRLFVGEALRALPQGRTLEVVAEIEPTVLRLSLDGATPGDLAPIRELARALGTDAGRVKNHEREAAWLTLPKA